MTERNLTVIYEPDSQVCRARHDRDDTPFTLTVIRAMAVITDRDAVDLCPLHDSVNTDAVDDLYSHSTDETISFTWEGYPVTVHADGEIEVDVSNDTRQTVA